MSEHALYLAPEKWGRDAELDSVEAGHARVLRLKVGDNALLLDGRGRTATCVVTAINRKSVQVRILEEKYTERPKCRAIMAIALSKAVRRGFFMEKASELGAWEILLWTAERSVGKLSQATVESCRGQLVAGMKQSLNPWLPSIAALGDVRDVAARAEAVDWRILPWENQNGLPMLEPDNLGRTGDSMYVLGPEGGFTDNEVECLINAGFMPASLGKRVLRCETAATLCLGLHSWAAQLPGHGCCRDGQN